MIGVDITLNVKTQTSTDPFGAPVYTVTQKTVSDVLVGEPSTDDVNNVLSLYGKKVVYTLAIPKGDEHNWEDTEVILPKPFAGTYHTIGIPTAGIEANIPLRWNKKVHLERITGKGQAESSWSSQHSAKSDDDGRCDECCDGPGRN